MCGCMCVGACVGACVDACVDSRVGACVCLSVWPHVCFGACVLVLALRLWGWLVFVCVGTRVVRVCMCDCLGACV